MTQFKDIPQATDNRNQSQVDLLNNARYLIDVSAPPAVTGVLPVDHRISANNTANPTDGFHNQISMLSKTLPTNLTNAINGQDSDGITYVRNDAQGFGQLRHFTKLTSTPTYIEYQITPCLPMRASANFTVAGGIVTITASFNVTSITRNSVGNYTVVFTTAIPSINYILSINGTTPTAGVLVASASTGPFVTNNLTLVFGQLGASSVDPQTACFMIQGG